MDGFFCSVEFIFKSPENKVIKVIVLNKDIFEFCWVLEHSENIKYFKVITDKSVDAKYFGLGTESWKKWVTDYPKDTWER